MSSMGASYGLLHVQKKRLEEKLHKEKERLDKDGGTSVGTNAYKSDGKNKIHPSTNFSNPTT
ncbi:hypothetical protein DCAR_0312995 [Daucus carota subsp. sativus]|uniref:Uncharacterized protein n=1 Tax=Daucus carota subsp. sativus TaxID=79200 RepID=A0A166BQ77_DAUCS|nr:hypothetical protein DCAR_0312995 [Daucus carota subsp. sativus]